MKAASRMIEVAASQPREALTDALGLLALVGIVFLGFAATAIA